MALFQVWGKEKGELNKKRTKILSFLAYMRTVGRPVITFVIDPGYRDSGVLRP